MSVEVLTLAACERLNDTVNRNPRYRIAFRGGLVALSQSDASWTYAMGNPGMRAGDRVMVTFSRAGRIVHMEPWSGEPTEPRAVDIPHDVLLAAARAAVATTGEWVKDDPEYAERVAIALAGDTAGGSIAAPAVHAAMVAAIKAYDAYRRGDGYDCNGGCAHHCGS
jgi:hypothetical protein